MSRTCQGVVKELSRNQRNLNEARTDAQRADAARWMRTYREKKRRRAWKEKAARAARVDASLHNLVERVEGAVLGHILTLVITSPPAVSRALLAWDSTPETGYI